MTVMTDKRAVMRLARRLAGNRCRLEPDGGGAYRFPGESGPVPAQHLAELRARGALEVDDGGLRLSPVGLAMVRRHLAGGEAFAAQHQVRTVRRIDEADGPRSVAANAAESPLAWLRGRKGRDGRPLIGAAEFEAGERLRSDFTRGQLMPRVTANWSAAVASGRRSGDAGGIADLTDAALAARLRFERALDAVGPEFSGLLVDFCCFLKGIEAIEAERDWPKRSAKLVLQLGLSSLARHYGLAGRAEAPKGRGTIRHWGAEDYRPRVG